MRLIIRVEGNTRIGLGHVMRCLALAQALKASGHEVFFMMTDTTANFCVNRADWCADVINLPDMPLADEPSWLVEQCIRLKADWLILDGYQFDQAYKLALVNDAFKLALFDDLNDSGALPAQMIINGAHQAKYLNYLQSAPQAFLALGEQYQVLRQEFIQLADKSWKNRHGLSLMFGGSDPLNLTLSCLQTLEQAKANMPITVLTGSAYKNLAKLQAFIQHSNLTIQHLHDCQNMASVLRHSRLAISAAGSSQFELLACATPAILVVVAKNQMLATQHAAEQKWCQIQDFNQLDAQKIVQHGLTLWEQTEQLKQMHENALKLPVHNGGLNLCYQFERLTEKNTT